MNGRQVEELCENETAARNEEMNEECGVRGGTKKLLSELYEQERTEFFHFLVPLSSSRNCQSPHKSKNLNNAPRSPSFNNLMHFPLSIDIVVSSTTTGKFLSDKSAADGPKSAKKLEALSKTSQCKQHSQAHLWSLSQSLRLLPSSTSWEPTSRRNRCPPSPLASRRALASGGCPQTW